MRLLWLFQRFYHKPGQWIPFTLIYLAVFFISLRCVIAIADGYDGNNWFAELGATVFYFFEFPVFTFWSLTGGYYNSNYDNLIWIALIVNLLLNYLLTVLIASLILNRSKR